MLSDPGGRKRDSLKEDEVSSGLHEREPNGDIENATPLVLTKERREILGELKDLDLIDWFELSFAEIGDYTVIVRPTKDLDVSLFLPDQSYAFDVEKRGGEEVILATHTDRVRFAVKREAKSEGKYTIAAVKTLKLDGVEKEPNNDAPRANHLDLEKGMTGQVTQTGDRDVFSLTTNRSWDMQITGDKNDIFTLKFCEDEAFAMCSRVYAFTGKTLKIPSFDTQSKTLFLVLAAEKPTKKYRIHGRVRPISKGFREEVEPNDTFAMEISSDESRVSIRGFLKDEDDVDVFHVKDWNFYYYTLQSLDSNLNLIGLDNRNIVGKFTSCRVSGNGNIGVKFGKRKAPVQGSAPDYRLEIIRYLGAGFESEPNGSLEEANDSVDDMVGEIVAGDDIDYYRVVVGKDLQPSLDIINLSGSDLRASMVDEEGLDLIGDSLIPPGRFKQFKMAFPEGKYFVRVYGQTADEPDDGVKHPQKKVSKREDECRPYRLRLHIK